MIRGKHKLRATRHTTNEYGRFETEWECVGCGMQSGARTKFEKNPCEEPVLWVEMGCPGDGLFQCQDCGTVFVDEYGQKPFYERECPSCGSIKSKREDDPDVGRSEVKPLSAMR